MEFKIIEQNKDLRVILTDGNMELAKATCYFVDTPEIDGKNIGCIGEFECNNKDNGIQIIKKCEELLKEKGVKVIVAPMNGNTWKKYRALKYSRGDEMFLLENVNPKEHNDIFIEAGFKETHEYTSTKGLVENAYKSKALRKAEASINDEGISIRHFEKENAYQDLQKIYNVSKIGFERNPLYTPIEEQEFIKQYEPYIDIVDEDFILIAEKDGHEVGFIFCVPDFTEAQRGLPVKTLILKTIAVLPEYEKFALGNVLLSQIGKKAKEKNFKEWIFAFMYSNNTSQKMAKRNGTEVIREYAIYSKEI